MSFIEKFNQELNELHLLNHPFYQAWSDGKLNRETLQTYAKEYYHHVAAFPMYIAAIYSQCKSNASRQILLGNLIEEDQGLENHPELWQRFLEGTGLLREDIGDNPKLKQTKDLVNGYFDLVRKDYATGLGALYAYERQTPEVSKSKIDGLEKFYGINDERSLKFSEIHMKADEWHSEECANLIEDLDEENRFKAKEGARIGAKLLWGFLDGMMIEHRKYV